MAIKHAVIDNNPTVSYLRVVFATMLLLTSCTMVYAQQNKSVSTSQIWLDYNPTIRINERLVAKGSIGFRTVAPNSWNRIWNSNYVSYDWQRFILKDARYKEQLIGGLDIYYTANKNDVNRLELTPFQAYGLTLPNRDHLVIKHYLKLEERFEIETNDWENTFGLRLSYQASISINFRGKIWSVGKGFYLPVSVRFFWNLIGTNQFNDKVRITPGLGYHISPDLKVAFLLGYNLTRNAPDEDLHYNDIIYRLRVYHNLSRSLNEK